MVTPPNIETESVKYDYLQDTLLKEKKESVSTTVYSNNEASAFVDPYDFFEEFNSPAKGMVS